MVADGAGAVERLWYGRTDRTVLKVRLVGASVRKLVDVYGTESKSLRRQVCRELQRASIRPCFCDEPLSIVQVLSSIRPIGGHLGWNAHTYGQFRLFQVRHRGWKDSTCGIVMLQCVDQGTVLRCLKKSRLLFVVRPVGKMTWEGTGFERGTALGCGLSEEVEHHLGRRAAGRLGLSTAYRRRYECTYQCDVPKKDPSLEDNVTPLYEFE